VEVISRLVLTAKDVLSEIEKAANDVLAVVGLVLEDCVRRVYRRVNESELFTYARILATTGVAGVFAKFAAAARTTYQLVHFMTLPRTFQDIRAVLQRAVKFGLAGVLATSVAYLTFILLLKVTHYLPAAALSWAASVCVGFAANRRFTFGISGSQGRKREFVLFMIGAGLQLLIALIGYAILIGHFKIAPTPAFLLNLILTTTFSFAFSSLVTFRR
jgi:putative flippase GtrA